MALENLISDSAREEMESGMWLFIFAVDGPCGSTKVEGESAPVKVCTQHACGLSMSHFEAMTLMHGSCNLRLINKGQLAGASLCINTIEKSMSSFPSTGEPATSRLRAVDWFQFFLTKSRV